MAQIPPKSEWPSMSLSQLYNVKTDMTNMYWNMRSANASYANQYLEFINHIDRIIAFKEQEMAPA